MFPVWAQVWRLMFNQPRGERWCWNKGHVVCLSPCLPHTRSDVPINWKYLYELESSMSLLLSMADSFIMTGCVWSLDSWIPVNRVLTSWVPVNGEESEWVEAIPVWVPVSLNRVLLTLSQVSLSRVPSPSVEFSPVEYQWVYIESSSCDSGPSQSSPNSFVQFQWVESSFVLRRIVSPPRLSLESSASQNFFSASLTPF